MPTKKKVTKKPVKKTKAKKEDKNKPRRKKITKWIFFGSWIAWFLIMAPMYLPKNTCAAFFEFLTHASFACPTISMIISWIMGSLFMAFITWIIGLIVTWIYFYHERMTWENLRNFFKE